MKKSFSILLAACAVATTSCSSIVSKSEYPVTFQSTTPNVKFNVKDTNGDTIHSANTPATVNLRASNGYFKKAKYTVDFQKRKHKETKELSAKIDPWYGGNVIFGGLIGLIIVDPATGAMYKLDDKVLSTL
ncbi:hypothetical protein SAMN02745181_2886 [Rubritalea squalenifaciens DSM 18772]|uniref:Lipoprotein n=1 Tax=Rubritalea squalenifaciens DSM 18772 TaxID=1123071 RepID=A0A1M6NKR4_9BACT|nr:hypothetical protein [Rubritalea squalenifaciens]SHJ96266.1 hypothetical protein SAMN02745181_2886 [Rubritalea squalenifaciens DSM 18772]